MRQRPPRSRRAARRASLFGLAAVALVLAAAGCSAGTGAYAPLDWASEMHYSQVRRSQEPPRLAAPAGAVPVTGREVVLASADYAVVENPVATSPETRVRGAELFRVNCSMCHGGMGKGDGATGRFVQRDYGLAPPNLTVAAVAAKADGELFGTITNGIFVMPSFRTLLRPEERWLIIRHIRTLQGP